MTRNFGFRAGQDCQKTQWGGEESREAKKNETQTRRLRVEGGTWAELEGAILPPQGERGRGEGKNRARSFGSNKEELVAVSRTIFCAQAVLLCQELRSLHSRCHFRVVPTQHTPPTKTQRQRRGKIAATDRPTSFLPVILPPSPSEHPPLLRCVVCRYGSRNLRSNTTHSGVRTLRGRRAD